MEPKRYIGNDLARIYQRVRRELGPEAVIVETRSLLRAGAEPLIELLAYGPEEEGLALALQQQLVNGVLARVEGHAPPRTIGDLEDLAEREFELSHPSQQMPPAAATEFDPDLPDWLEGFVEHAPSAPGHHLRSLAEDEQELSPLQFATRTVPQTTPLHTSNPPTGQRVDTPLEPLGGRFAPLPPAIGGHLTAAGFSPAAALAVEPFAQPGRSVEEALADALGALPLSYPDERQTSLISIQGVAGSGRTTALIRMALDCADSGRTAILVAADSSRIAAREQIHAYGEALGLQVCDAHTHQELVQAVSAAPRGACLFVDVPAGPWHAPALPSVKHFAYLTLPSHWQQKSLASSLSAFPHAAYAGVVLTFTDLAGEVASALSAALERQIGVAFLSSSRDVSTGIEVADLFTLASGIFTTPSGGKANGRLVASA